ncbi:MAG: Histidinol-phosphate aminotransferase [bacterium]|nr:Histidinol-phosphate aminotransferase [bacterium]
MGRRIEDLIRPYLQQVTPYVPGKPVAELRRELGLPEDQPIIKLASNENVLGVSPQALAILRTAIEDVWQYPEDSCFYLRQALAAHHGVTPDHIYLGNGGVATLMDLGRVLLEPGDQAIAARPSFMKYRIVSQWTHALPTPLTDEDFLAIAHPDHIHDVEAMGRAISDRTKIVWVCNPNNPTGQMLTTGEIDRLLELNANRAVVVLDEAYADFVEPGCDYPDSLTYLRAGHHVAILRTLAKIGGIAGLRLGYLIAPPTLVQYLDRIRLTFSVNRLAQEAGMAALTDTEFIRRSQDLVWTEKRYYYDRLHALGWAYKPTQANFIWIHIGRSSRDFAAALNRHGVIIRPGWIFDEPEWIRVTFGTREMNARFFQAAELVMAEMSASAVSAV